MSKRDKEIVEDYKRVFSAMFSTPHLVELVGNWYWFEKKGERPFVSYVDENGYLDGDCMNGFDYFTGPLGYTATPLLVYKVDTEKLR